MRARWRSLRRRAWVLEDARQVLARHGLSCSRVISVDRDSILCLNGIERPRTVWLHVSASGKQMIHMSAGFQAEPPAGWQEQQPGG